MKLTGTETAILHELARLGLNGGLTGNIASRLFGAGTSSDRIRRPCLKMAGFGLVFRLPANDQRWFISDAGRSALVSPTSPVAKEERHG
jgi:hypothetical protein